MGTETNKVSSLLKNASWFFYIDIIGRGLALLLMPLYTAYMSPTDYGIVAICLTTAAIIEGFNALGLPQFAGRILYRFHNKKKYLGILLGNIYAVSFILILVTSLTLSLFPGLIHKTFFDNSEIPAAIILFVPIWLCFFRKISETLRDYQVINQLGRQVFIFSVSRNISLHVLKIIALVVFKLGVVGFLMAELIVEAIIATSSAILLIYMVRPKVNFRKRGLIKMGLRYSLPYIPNNLSGWVIGYIDRILILKLMLMWNVGLYSFGMAFATSIFNLCWNPVRSGINPEIPKQLDNPKDNPNVRKNVVEFLYTSILFLSFVTIGLTIFGKGIIHILANERFHSAYILLPLFAAYLMFQNIREIVQLPIMIKNKTGFFPFNTFTAAAINIVVNLILIPIWGIVGAALATVLTNFVMLVCALIYAQHLIYIEYNYFIACLPVIVSAVLLLPAILIDMPLGLCICWGIAATILYTAFGYHYIAKVSPGIHQKILITIGQKILNKTKKLKLPSNRRF